MKTETPQLKYIEASHPTPQLAADWDPVPLVGQDSDDPHSIRAGAGKP